MNHKKVRDLMVPLSEYAIVPHTATLTDAIRALDASQKHVSPDRQPHRAVLVVDPAGRVIGKIGQWALLKALEPRYQEFRNDESLARAGVTHQQLSSLLEHTKFFRDNLNELCEQVASESVKRIMSPVAEAVDAAASLGEAMHRLIVAQALSLLVTSNDQVIGVLRLSDLADEAMKIIRTAAASDKNGQE